MGFEGTRCDKSTQRFVISRLPTLQTSTLFIPVATSSTSSQTSTSSPTGPISSVLNRLVDRKIPSLDDVISDVANGNTAKKSTSIKVTKIIKHVEVHSSDILVHDVKVGENPVSSQKENTDGQASVSVVQAVTFAFLGVAVALFISIGLFLWLHCRKRRKSSACWRSRRSSEDRFIEGEEDREAHTSIVRKEPPKYEEVKKSIYQPKPGLVVRTISPPRGQLVVKPRPQVDCLYVALPRNHQMTSELSPIASIDETNSLLECSKLNRSSNFYHQRR